MIKKIIFLFVVFFPIFSFAEVFEGEYRRDYSKISDEEERYIETGLVRVEELELGKIYFSISAAAGTAAEIHSSQVRATIPVSGNTATYIDQNKRCALKLTFLQDRVNVEQDISYGNCGSSVYYKGVYLRSQTTEYRATQD